MTGSHKVVIIDDEKNFAEVLGNEVRRMGFEVDVTNDGKSGLEVLSKREADLVLLDIRMPDLDGLEVLKRIRGLDNPPEVIMLTGHATVDTALDAMKAGAYDYLTKPCKLDELEVVIQKAVEKLQAVRTSQSLRSYLGKGSPTPSSIVGESSAMQNILQKVPKIAQATDVPVLVTGESGTGKEIIAREIHKQSPLSEQPFIAVNCAALQSTVLESELFGHEKGAFTGAVKRKSGLFELATGGTLFLDEIGEMEEKTQAKLLRAVQFGEYRRVGGEESLTADVRVIAATNRDLAKAVESSEFREDLYYRLNVVQVHLPPLRERPEDILPLADFFLRSHGRGGDYSISRDAGEILTLHSWPGNVRELENFIRRLLIFQESPTISGDDVQGSFQVQPTSDTAASAAAKSMRLEEIERLHILRVLKLCDGNKTEAAERLGIAQKTLYNKLNAYKEKGLSTA